MAKRVIMVDGLKYVQEQVYKRLLMINVWAT